MQSECKSDMSLEEKEKLRKAQELLLFYMPHFRYLLSVAKAAGIDVTAQDDVKTAQTYPNARIDISRRFFERLQPDEVAFVLAHELGHHYLDTFGRRGKSDGSPTLHNRVNVASDTLINYMINNTFRKLGSTRDFSADSSILHNMKWWKTDRYYYRGTIVHKELPKKNKILLVEACKKADIPWRDAQEATMEYVLDTLTQLERIYRDTQQQTVDKWSVSGSLLIDSPENSPWPWPVRLTLPRTETVEDQLTFKCSVPTNWNDNPVCDIQPTLKLHLNMHTRDLQGPNWNSRDLTLDSPYKTPQCMEKGDFIVYTRDKTHPWYGSLKLSRKQDNRLTLEGFIQCCLPKTAQGTWLVAAMDDDDYQGSCRTIEELKANHPDDPNVNDRAIARAMREIRKARSFAARHVSEPTALDLEVQRECCRIPWEGLLQNWWDGNLLTRRDWNRASRRGVRNDGVCLPGHRHCGHILNVILDTSGSMDKQLLEKALSAIAYFCSQNNIDSIRILECDERLQDIKTITPLELSHYVCIGRGRTDMTPAIRQLAMDPDVTGAIILTDGVGVRYPQTCPPYKVLWAIVGEHCNTDFSYGTVTPIAP